MTTMRRSIIRPVGAVIAVAAMVSLAACSTGSGDDAGDPTATRAGELTMAYNLATETQDPISAVSTFYSFPAYDTLIHWAADGSFEPDLAVEWGFVDDANTVFELTLRDGVTFSDGAEMDADAVVSSMQRFLSEANNAASVGDIARVTAVDEATVQIEYASSLPEDIVLRTLTQQFSFTMIVSPDALADTDVLASSTAGVGPYVYDATQSVAGGVQVYLPNDEYFNQDAIRYEKVVINPISSDATRLSSALTGENDVVYAVPLTSVSQVEDAGMQLSEQTSSAVNALLLQNIADGPMSDLRVRQAMAYAIPREAIIDAVFNGYGYATSSNSFEGFAGYLEEDVDMFAYDLDKAKELMADAGYEDGFTISIGVPSGADTNLTQAIAVAMGEIGVTVELTNITVTTAGGGVELEYDGGFDPGVPTQSIYQTVNLLDPTGYFNPYEFSDAELDAAMAAVTEVSGDEQTAALEEVTSIFDSLAWRLVISVQPTITAVAEGIENVPAAVLSGIACDPFSPTAEDAWYGTP